MFGLRLFCSRGLFVRTGGRPGNPKLEEVSPVPNRVGSIMNLKDAYTMSKQTNDGIRTCAGNHYRMPSPPFFASHSFFSVFSSIDPNPFEPKGPVIGSCFMFFFPTFFIFRLFIFSFFFPVSINTEGPQPTQTFRVKIYTLVVRYAGISDYVRESVRCMQH